MPYSRKKLTFVTDPSSDIANAPRQSSNDECSNNESEGEGTHPIECDVGKLKNDRVDLHQLSRDDKYRLLTSQPNSDPSSYPRTRPYTTSSFRRFLPSCVVVDLGCITAGFWTVHSAKHVCFLLQIRLVVKI